jgi:hypothetical protein
VTFLSLTIRIISSHSSSADDTYFERRGGTADWFEDGTINFLSIMAVLPGLAVRIYYICIAVGTI